MFKIRAFYFLTRPNKPKGLSLYRWIWLSYWRAALIPLIGVELALVLVYVLSHNFSKSQNIDTVQQLAETEVQRLAENYSASISEQLAAVSQMAALLADHTAVTLSLPPDPQLEDSNRYQVNENGSLWSNGGDEGAAVYYSGAVPLGDEGRYKVSQTARLDPLLRELVDYSPLVVQAYVNTWDSLNRIWPVFDVVEQYPPAMDIPTYNFYYEADALYNPEREVVWTAPYLDPAGRGWMVSAIAPVYQGDFLEAVVGLDITLDVVVNQVLNLPVPWQGFALLTSRDGMLLAVADEASGLLNLPELSSTRYQDIILTDAFTPDAFNVRQRPELRPLSSALDASLFSHTVYTTDQSYLMATRTLPDNLWRLSVIAPGQKILEPVNSLSEGLTDIGWLLLLGLIIFYALFFTYLSLRARALGHTIAKPLEGINRMVAEIEKGNYLPQKPDTHVTEFRETMAEIDMMASRIATSEAQLIQARDEANRANDAKSAFLANMSHEIRTPLTAVIGLSELARDATTAEQLQQYLDNIRSASSSLLITLNDVLDFSAIEAGKLELECAPFNPESVIRDVSALFAPSMIVKSIDFTLQVAREVPFSVLGDAQRIRQILINLVGNALKFTEKGHVRFTLERGMQVDDSCELVFCVEDSGIGISEATLDSLFAPFSQADSTITRRFGGSGLGLAICRELADLMQGTLSVSSKPDIGSIFRFTLSLPVLEEHQATCHFSTPWQLDLLSSDTTLIDSLECHLVESGLNVSVVSGPQALAKTVGTDGELCWLIDQSFLDSHQCSLDSLLAQAPTLPGLILLLSNLREDLPVVTGKTPLYSLCKPVTPGALLSRMKELLMAPGLAGSSTEPWESYKKKLRGRRVLIVEDMEANRQIACGWLEKVGIDVHLAENGGKALELLEKNAYDLVLMDVQMPDMGGIEATRQLRQLPGKEKLPVIAVSAGVFSEEIQSCISAGMDDFLGKPMQPDKLYAMLDKRMGNKDNTPAAGSTVRLEYPSFSPDQILLLAENDMAKAGKLIQMMIDTLAEKNDQLTKDLDNNNMEDAVKTLHQLKGTIGYYWQGNVFHLAARLEIQLRQGFPLSAEQKQQWEHFSSAAILEMQEFVDQYCLSES